MHLCPVSAAAEGLRCAPYHAAKVDFKHISRLQELMPEWTNDKTSSSCRVSLVIELSWPAGWETGLTGEGPKT